MDVSTSTASKGFFYNMCDMEAVKQEFWKKKYIERK